jgi:hypothetical protein
MSSTRKQQVLDGFERVVTGIVKLQIQRRDYVENGGLRSTDQPIVCIDKDIATLTAKKNELVKELIS